MVFLAPLPTPNELVTAFPIDETLRQNVLHARQRVQEALHGHGFLIIMGPCSLDGHEGALRYAELLCEAQKSLPSEWVIVMRAFFEKPRSLDGWKGYVHASHPDELIGRVEATRVLLRSLLNSGVALGSELLQPALLPYVEDCLSWGCIGARTCSSQIHRELASAAPFPVGIKNDLTGDVKTALDSIWSARHPQSTYQINGDGRLCAAIAPGNADSHIILRGGFDGPNISPDELEVMTEGLEQRQIPTQFLIDCAHGNARKTSRGQLQILDRLPLEHPRFGGIMLESYLHEGRQLVQGDPTPGLSVTDPCLSWEQTLLALHSLADSWAAGSIQLNQS
ncbi:MAG: 3-deoxy-7-phosphoheptulonate synthase [Chlamydiia bacterium]